MCLSFLPEAQIGQGLAPDFLVFLALGSIVGLTMGLIALLLGGTLNATVGPRGAYVVAGVAGLVAVAVAAVRLRPHLRAGAPP